MKVFTVHGIRKQNAWYEYLPTFDEAKIYNIEFIYFDYGYFSFRKFLSRKHRQKILNKFCNFYNDNNKPNEPLPCVIAHSFGTYLVFQAMKKYDVIKFDKIIFCGSILNQNTNFRDLIKRKQFKVLKNDHGSLEWYLKYTRRFIDKDCGQAGKVGFLDVPADNKNFIINSGSYKSHSEYFLPLHMQENWLNFLTADLQKFKYNSEILTPNILNRIYENLNRNSDSCKINKIQFFVRIDKDGNYFAKYNNEGVNESRTTELEFIQFTTTADGFHDANAMNLTAYDKDDKKLSYEIIQDVNHKKTFKILFDSSVKFSEFFSIKYYFCWYNTINFKGDTDHWNFQGVEQISIVLNFPFELLLPKLFIVKNRRLVDQFTFQSKKEMDNTFTYSYDYSNGNTNDGAIFYFEKIKETFQVEKHNRVNEFSIRGRKDSYTISKAIESDIKNVYQIEVNIEHGNAASEGTLSLRRKTFNDGFLIVKQKRTGRIVGYIESIIWNEKKFEAFSDISNFPLHYNVTGNAMYVIFLAVDSAFRQQGIATKLIEELEKVAKEYKLIKIGLVAKDNLTFFYKKFGYHEVRELPHFLSDRSYKSVLMEKFIK